jgi:undecaprenyl-diphosphatase
MGAETDRGTADERLGRGAFSPRTRRGFLAWGSASTLLCLALCAVATRSPETLDRWDQALRLGPDWWRATAPWLEGPLLWISSAFGLVASAIATAVVAGLLVTRKQNRAAAYVVLVMAGTSLVNTLLKRYVDLARPVVADPILQYTSSAMPSGHASNIAAAVTVASVLSALFLHRRAHRRVVLLVGVLVALVVGLDRLMLGVHTLTEVVAGYALGVGVGLLAAYVVNPAWVSRERDKGSRDSSTDVHRHHVDPAPDIVPGSRRGSGAESKDQGEQPQPQG